MRAGIYKLRDNRESGANPEQSCCRIDGVIFLVGVSVQPTAIEPKGLRRRNIHDDV